MLGPHAVAADMKSSNKSSFNKVFAPQHGCQIRIMQAPRTSGIICLAVEHVCNETAFLASASNHKRISVVANGCVKMQPSYRGFYFSQPDSGKSIYSPLHKLATLQNIVTVLRNPTERIVSAFCNHVVFDGINETADVDIFFSNSRAESSRNFEKYTSYRSVLGCYAKMLNGVECVKDIEITNTMIENAKFMLSEFLFVGILEEYSSSVKLFHRMHNATVLSPPHPVEFSIIKRPKNKCKEYLLANHKYFEDPYDSIIYNFALNLFHQRLRQYLL